MDIIWEKRGGAEVLELTLMRLLSTTTILSRLSLTDLTSELNSRWMTPRRFRSSQMTTLWPGIVKTRLWNFCHLWRYEKTELLLGSNSSLPKFYYCAFKQDIIKMKAEGARQLPQWNKLLSSATKRQSQNFISHQIWVPGKQKFLSAAIGQRPRNYLSCCCCSCSPFGSIPHLNK